MKSQLLNTDEEFKAFTLAQLKNMDQEESKMNIETLKTLEKLQNGKSRSLIVKN